MAKTGKLKHYALLSICFLAYLSAVVLYTLWSYHEREKLIIAELDDKISTAAMAVKFMLAPDFQDRAVNEKSITYKEELKNRDALNGFVKETGFTWIYTLVEKDGNFYFSAPTVTGQEANEKKSWYFYPYKDIPEEFVTAFRDKKPCYLNYSDQWGTYRSVAIPQITENGRVYLSCADYDIHYLTIISRDNIIKSILSALYFIFFSIPFILVFRIFFRSYSVTLKEINDELVIHKENLESLIDERTAELSSAYDRLHEELMKKNIIENKLTEEKNRLSEALQEVKTLSGLLPICASCKNIRDDSGYWNQIEKYIQDHSEAKFSHGICPDCAKKLYPGYKL